MKLDLRSPATWSFLPLFARGWENWPIVCKLCGKPITSGQEYYRRSDHRAHADCVKALEEAK